MPDEDRARLDQRARRAGFKNYQEYLDAWTEEEYRGYRYWVRSAAEKLSSETGMDMQDAIRKVRRTNSDFHRHFSKVARNGFLEGNPKAEGKGMHEFLSYLGLRDERDWWGVGDTPDLE